jgi:peptide subunit release factor 1 (eRF1)
LLLQEISEVQAICEGFYDSEEDDEDMTCYSDSSSDDEVDLNDVLEQLIEENKKLEVNLEFLEDLLAILSLFFL